MSDALLRWCVDQLHHNFGLEANDDIVQYILSINNADEIAEYVGDLLQGTDGRKKQFIDELLDRWQRSQKQTPDSVAHRRYASLDVPDMSKDSQKKSKRKGRNKQEVVAVSPAEPEQQVVKTPIDLMKAQESGGSSLQKKKNKFVSLYNKEGQDRLGILLPGRHSCECLAQKHSLVNNCMCCGRIVCAQEGSGPCFFCGSLVCTKEEQEILQRDSNKSQKLRKKLMEGASERDCLPHTEAKMKAGLEKALEHKDKLLEYDKNSTRRTQVLDDESDYFATDSNQWLSQSEREHLRKKEEELRELRHASRKDRKITLDFAGRRVLDEEDNLNHYYNKFDETVKALNTGTKVRSPQRSEGPGGRQHLRELVNPNIGQAAPEWVDVGGGVRRAHEKGVGTERGAADTERSRIRLQDRELQEMADGGWCLSMHQPWASLLVKGIKKAEGRSWYTSHRGRLWIAAAAKKPEPEETKQVENMYRQIYKTEPKFPDDYPTGCLLGCVHVADCLPQEQYKDQFPQTCEESGSPFVFVCTNPQELVVKFPMKGKHKICKGKPAPKCWVRYVEGQLLEPGGLLRCSFSSPPPVSTWVCP
uniref:Activating signal cointegrator 1 n=1 Tax=Esox lucius TaxID=8010 RepID=A0A3P8Z4E9_ESOLU